MTRWQSKNRVFRIFLKICSFDFSDFCMRLEGMVGHKMGLAVISWKFWFFHNGGILHAKINLSSISQEPFDSFCSFFIKMSQIANSISTRTSFHLNYPIKRHSCSDMSENRPCDGTKLGFFRTLSKSFYLIFMIFAWSLIAWSIIAAYYVQNAAFCQFLKKFSFFRGSTKDLLVGFMLCYVFGPPQGKVLWIDPCPSVCLSVMSFSPEPLMEFFWNFA